MISIEKILSAQNVAEELPKDDLSSIGLEVVASYDRDLQSRKEWEVRMDDSLNLAMQMAKKKTFPWPGASNVKFPLLCIASMQFHGRVYPVMIPGEDLVKLKVIGADPQGAKKARATRVGTHMSYQCYEQDVDWEQNHDALLMTLPITGSEFVKSYFNPLLKHPQSEWVTSRDLVVPYLSKSLESAPRITHRLYMTDHDIRERVLAGIFMDLELGPIQSAEVEGSEDERTGMTESEPEHRLILEQHRFLDLDDDGYQEPYIVTVEKDTGLVLRIMPRFSKASIVTDKDDFLKKLGRQAMSTLPSLPPQEGVRVGNQVAERMEQIKAGANIIRIAPDHYFTKISFVPSPDGGIYDLGFGSLLGPINESINTAINQLFDSGTLSTAAGGFLGRGIRMRGGKQKFDPFEWKRIDTAGVDIKNNIVPLPVRNPSPVLFSLLQLLINYGERLASVTDMMQGITPGQNTPATTSQSALEQGLQVFHGIFKRVYRGFRDEFRKRYTLNQKYLEPEEYAGILDLPPEQIQNDYRGSENDVRPVADPKMMTSAMKMQTASFLAQRSEQKAGYNPVEVEKRLLEAMGVEDTEAVYPTEEGKQIPPPKNPDLELKAAEEQRRTLEAQSRAEKSEAETAISKQLADADIGLKQLQALEIAARISLLKHEAEAQKIENDITESGVKEILDRINGQNNTNQ